MSDFLPLLNEYENINVLDKGNCERVVLNTVKLNLFISLTVLHNMLISACSGSNDTLKR